MKPVMPPLVPPAWATMGNIPRGQEVKKYGYLRKN